MRAPEGLATPSRLDSRSPGRRHSGAALLAAMLIVALVATFAAAALWQQWRAVELEAAQRARAQAGWVLTGALDWARLILREDARSGGADHLAEPWAVPLQEARLSTFLAADRGADTAGSDIDGAFLSGEIVDQQSLLNLSNLLEAGRVSETGLRSFSRLFEVLGLPPAQLSTLAENLRFAGDISTDNRSAGQAALMPQRVEQLTWLGVPVATVAALQPYVTLLPSNTPVNLNTASAEVIYAAVGGISLADAQRLVSARDRSHFRSLNDARELLPGNAQILEGTAGVASRYFEVRGRLRIDRTQWQERSLIQRDGLDVRTIARERGLIDASALAQAALATRR